MTPSDVLLPSSVHAVLYRYWLTEGILHAVSAELYQDGQLIVKARPIHCGMLTDRVLKMHLQSTLETFSHYSKTAVVAYETVELLLSRHGCPIEDCHLNPLNRLEELL